jgi:hypothetical protein
LEAGAIVRSIAGLAASPLNVQKQLSAQEVQFNARVLSDPPSAEIWLGYSTFAYEDPAAELAVRQSG